MNAKRLVAGMIACGALVVGAGFATPSTTHAAEVSKVSQGEWVNADFTVEHNTSIPQVVSAQVDTKVEGTTMVKHGKKTYVYLSLGTQGAVYDFNVKTAVIKDGNLSLLVQAEMNPITRKLMPSPEFVVLSFDNTKYQINEVHGHLVEGAIPVR
ncbi:hypothetical protein J2Z48_000169 [Croceifilum oryzae]|uniref:Uncharacterized protein n=1 Tax=Croceifilum oryzae TaxID=1553429 RepID=A0AAJ1TJS2_9BACL|nr:hypothetical protein [Croceifilum oryzae]MDQ0416011.1 hypothetical protein [Croceifilum oryzae]